MTEDPNKLTLNFNDANPSDGSLEAERLPGEVQITVQDPWPGIAHAASIALSPHDAEKLGRWLIDDVSPARPCDRYEPSLTPQEQLDLLREELNRLNFMRESYEAKARLKLVEIQALRREHKI